MCGSFPEVESIVHNFKFPGRGQQEVVRHDKDITDTISDVHLADAIGRRRNRATTPNAHACGQSPDGDACNCAVAMPRPGAAEATNLRGFRQVHGRRLEPYSRGAASLTPRHGIQIQMLLRRHLPGSRMQWPAEHEVVLRHFRRLDLLTLAAASGHIRCGLLGTLTATIRQGLPSPNSSLSFLALGLPRSNSSLSFLSPTEPEFQVCHF